MLQVASGRKESISIFGQDYATPDGTCIRDYIHICDLCETHLLVIKTLQSSNKRAVYNLGNGNGFSVKEVVDMARKELNWKPGFSSLDDIIKHAWLVMGRKINHFE